MPSEELTSEYSNLFQGDSNNLHKLSAKSPLLKTINKTNAEYINLAFLLIMKTSNRIKTIPKGEIIKGNSFDNRYVFKNNSK